MGLKEIFEKRLECLKIPSQFKIIPWGPGSHKNPKLNFVRQLLFFKLFNMLKIWPISKVLDS